MSRSYKSTPVASDNGRHTKQEKRRAASRIRNIDPESIESDILAGKSNRYKKIINDTYDIHDYINHMSEAEARKFYQEKLIEIINSEWKEKARQNFLNKYPTEDDFINKRWAKDYKRK